MTTNSKEYARKYYAEHKEMFREASKRYQEKKKLEKRLRVTNPRLFDMKTEEYRDYVKQSFKAPEKELTYSQRYYAENRDRIREQQRLARKRKKINEKQREYYAKNKEHIRAQQKRHRAEKKRQEKLSKTFM